MLRHPPRWLVPLARALVAGFVVLNVALIRLRPDLSIREDPISSYLDGDFRWLAVLSFVLLSAGGALLAVAARACGESSRTRLSPLLVVYSLGVLLAGLTHPGSTIHSVGALVAFAILPVAALASTGRLRLLWFTAMVASFATWPILHVGLGERLTVAIELAWLISLRLSPTPERPATPGTGTQGPGTAQT